MKNQHISRWQLIILLFDDFVSILNLNTTTQQDIQNGNYVYKVTLSEAIYFMEDS